jgi:DNA processing protein
VVSGNARGVDAEAHGTAVREGGSTILVLADGIAQFNWRAWADDEPDHSRIAVMSQFRPGQVWTVGSAMTRNATIASLSSALVVIEAGETGGTIEAGKTALRMGVPVLTLEFGAGGDQTPPGNRALIARGATAIRSRAELRTAIDKLEGGSRAARNDSPAVSQMTLMEDIEVPV